MLQGEHSAILSISVKLQFPIKALVLSIFKWPLKTGFTVHSPRQMRSCLFPVLKYHHVTTAEVIKLFSCSTQLSMKFQLFKTENYNADK